MTGGTVACLSGDCIGPELMAEARRVLAALAPELRLEEHPIGAVAIRLCGDPLPEDVLVACRAADAVLKAPVGDPQFDAADVRPEQAVLRLRGELGVFMNLRPVRHREVDLLIVRELTGGLYYGQKGTRIDGTVFDTCEYHPREVERVARNAFELARSRRGKLTSVDKANVLETSRLWRRVVADVGADYPDIELENMLVDNAAMQLAVDPGQFDVLLTENMFGDILSDLAASVAGGIALGASASLGEQPPGLFEPIHGSAPDIAGLGIANPAGMLGSVVLMLRHGFGEPEKAAALERAIELGLSNAPPPDQGGSATTRDVGDAVLHALADGPRAVPAGRAG